MIRQAVWLTVVDRVRILDADLEDSRSRTSVSNTLLTVQPPQCITYHVGKGVVSVYCGYNKMALTNDNVSGITRLMRTIRSAERNLRLYTVGFGSYDRNFRGERYK